MGFSIAIDGPSGVGKSTVAKNLAKKLKYIYVDTGAMYRTVALYCIINKIDLDNEGDVKEALLKMDIDIENTEEEQKIFLNLKDVTKEIRNQTVAEASSKVAKNKFVREKLVNIQREIAKDKNVIMDGRDIGSFVLPNANLKLYLTASLETRIERRKKELISIGEDVSIYNLKDEIIKRDNRDMFREISPLKKADDAICISTDNMNEEEVLEHILKLIR